MKFYHGTSEENWEKIQKEEVLWGKRGDYDRCTYLSVQKEDAMKYGSVLLEVEYEPYQEDLMGRVDNYSEGVWQFRVYQPILLGKIKRI